MEARAERAGAPRSAFRTTADLPRAQQHRVPLAERRPERRLRGEDVAARTSRACTACPGVGQGTPSAVGGSSSTPSSPGPQFRHRAEAGAADGDGLACRTAVVEQAPVADAGERI
ncbi:hypothetical protein [Streptomyces sp. DSM 15324]|uniref:hypothetical protein n=1 Tax=Streptomyces sp. DSM 15324 TaxID=1739111 RepID=UPI00074A97E7|nr:hypothetical protein [Streptomyces sp. DSM 15324]KUO07886.1 hypothetical protein AQJ58_33575 [Streptomyces sp. DSM 15324]